MPITKSTKVKRSKPRTKKYPRGKALMRAVINKIIADPDCWKQTSWHCGTRHCVGGWAQILGGRRANFDDVLEDAKMFLGLKYSEAYWLFESARSLTETYAFATAFIAGETFFDSDITLRLRYDANTQKFIYPPL